MDFDTIWTDYVKPLKGKTITTFSGKENKILSVEEDGITRITSQSTEPNHIRIEPFEWAVEQLLKNGCVARKDIEEKFKSDRCSAGVFAILMQVPFFDLVQDGPATLIFKNNN